MSTTSSNPDGDMGWGGGVKDDAREEVHHCVSRYVPAGGPGWWHHVSNSPEVCATKNLKGIDLSPPSRLPPTPTPS